MLCSARVNRNMSLDFGSRKQIWNTHTHTHVGEKKTHKTITKQLQRAQSPKAKYNQAVRCRDAPASSNNKNNLIAGCELEKS